MMQAKTNLFIKNLAPTCTNKKLFDMFRVFGEIFSSRLPQNFKGKSKGYGFVQFREQRAAEAAVKEMNGKEVEGKTLKVEPFKNVERKERNSTKFTNLFVKELPPGITTKEDLDKLFESFGKRTSVGLFQNELGGKIGYYGFVNFETPEQAAQALSQMNGKIIDNIPLYVTKALTKEQRELEKNRRRIELRKQSRKFTLYVKTSNGEPLAEQLVLEELKQFGEIKSVSIPKQKNAEGQDINSSVGYIVFDKEEEALKV